MQVTQYGARSLWDEAEAAFDQWVERGMPRRSRFGMTVDESGSHLWCDTPQQMIRPLPAAAGESAGDVDGPGCGGG